MIQRIRKAMKDGDRGFTLIELLVVILIIGILAAIALPRFLNQRGGAYDAQLKSDLHNLATEFETAMTNTGSYPKDVASQIDASTVTLNTHNTFTAESDGATTYLVVGYNDQSKHYYYVSNKTGNGPQQVSGSPATLAAALTTAETASTTGALGTAFAPVG